MRLQRMLIQERACVKVPIAHKLQTALLCMVQSLLKRELEELEHLDRPLKPLRLAYDAE